MYGRKLIAGSNPAPSAKSMKKQIVKDAFGWGFLLWFIGYALGIILFSFVPTAFMGWVIMPIGIAITLWVLIKKIKVNSFRYYLKLGVIWTLMAILLDYFLLVKLFKPAGGYYKGDVYLYYVLTFLLPVAVGWRKGQHHK
jgi:hypothetical protein